MRDSNSPSAACPDRAPDLSNLCLAITEHSPLPMATVEGEDHVVRYVNPAFCHLLGKAREALVDQPFRGMLNDRDEVLRFVDRVFRTGTPASHTDRKHAVPHPVFWSYTMWPVIADGRTVGVMLQVTETAQFHRETLSMNEALILGSLRQHELTEAADESNAQLRREVAERRRAEAEVRRRAAEFEALLSDVPLGVFLVDGGFCIRQVNAAALPVFRNIAGLIGRRLDEVMNILWQPQVAGDVVQKFRHTLDTGEPYFCTEYIEERRDSGVTEYYEWQIHRIAVPEGGHGVVCYFRDISFQVRVRAELKEGDSRKDEFLAMLAHELRNPLAPISYMLEVMKRADGNNDLIQPALNTIERQVGQMARLIDDLLDVSRISRGKLQLRREQIELAAVIQLVVEPFRAVYQAARHELTVTLPSQPLMLYADQARLVQVFGNLLNNASKFTEPGGHVALTAERQGSDAVITVTDSGIGISPEMLPKVFDMFVQGDRTMERAVGGLGIGLTLVRRLVEMHGGTVEAFSAGAGHGTEVVVRLPALTAKAAALPVREIRGATMTARRILIVDDNQDTAQSLSILLRLAGNDTHVAFDGVEAVAAAEQIKPELILMDIGMPKLNGYDAARRIRGQPGGEDIVLVALTGLGQPDDRKKAAEAGFDGHLVKPVEYAALTELLARCADRRAPPARLATPAQGADLIL